MITFKVVCDECKREVDLLDAIVFHPACYDDALREYANSFTEGRRALRLVSESELFDGIPVNIPPEELVERRILP